MKILNKLSQRNSDVTSCSPVTIAFLGDSVTHGVFELHQGYNCEMIMFGLEELGLSILKHTTSVV